MVSVLMGIYNCSNTLDEAIQCILEQTITDWELILCDDGSQDETWAVAQKYVKKYPEKIILLKNEKNRGLNYTLNRCMSVASGKYIARMDADDLCSKDRFEKEIYVLETEPEIDIVSTAMDFFDENGIWGSIVHPEYPVEKDFVYGSPFCHAPCMVRREAMERVGGYSEGKRLLRVEDYHLWLKMYLAGSRGKNIQESFYQMRDDRTAYSRRKFKYRINEAYVKVLVVKGFKLPIWNLVYAMRPIIVGMLPTKLYDILHKKNLRT